MNPLHLPYISPSLVRGGDFYMTLDPGIRLAVLWLHAYGFQTSDSGDGVSKFARAAGEGAQGVCDALNVPHVVIPTYPDVPESERIAICRWATFRMRVERLDRMLRAELGDDVFAIDPGAAAADPMYLPELLMEASVVFHQFGPGGVPADHIMLTGRGLLRLAPTFYLVGEGDKRLVACGQVEARRAAAWLLRDPSMAHTESRNRTIASNLLPVVDADGQWIALAGPMANGATREIPITTTLDCEGRTRWLATVEFDEPGLPGRGRTLYSGSLEGLTVEALRQGAE